MTGDVTIHIDSLSVLGLGDDADPEAVRKTVEAALRKLAERLARSPLSRSGARKLALERLSLDALPADELLSERGAERLADELYSVLTRRPL